MTTLLEKWDNRRIRSATSRPCEYCGEDLPEGVDKHTRRIRSAHFNEHSKERQEKEKGEAMTDITLPPLPSWAQYPDDDSIKDAIQDYARLAVEQDRAMRGK